MPLQLAESFLFGGFKDYGYHILSLLEKNSLRKEKKWKKRATIVMSLCDVRLLPLHLRGYGRVYGRCMDNDFIVYKADTHRWVKFNTEDEMDFNEAESLEDFWEK